MARSINYPHETIEQVAQSTQARSETVRENARTMRGTSLHGSALGPLGEGTVATSNSVISAASDRVDSTATELQGHARNLSGNSAAMRAVDQEHAGNFRSLFETLNGSDRTASNELFNKYYYRYGNEIRRKPDRPDFQGEDVPSIEENGDGFQLKENQLPIRGTYRGEPVDGDRATLPESEREPADLLAQLRPGNLTNLAEANATVDNGPQPGSVWNPPLDRYDRAGFQHVASEFVGEPLGEVAARHAMSDLAPEGSQVEAVTGLGGGAGRFDQVYRVHHQDGSTSYAILEAKGPSATLGEARGLDGQMYKQGHVEYVNAIVNKMEGGNPADASLAAELKQGLQNHQVDYFVAQARVEQVGGAWRYGGYERRQFDLGYPPTLS